MLQAHICVCWAMHSFESMTSTRQFAQQVSFLAGSAGTCSSSGTASRTGGDRALRMGRTCHPPSRPSCCRLQMHHARLRCSAAPPLTCRSPSQPGAELPIVHAREALAAAALISDAALELLGPAVVLTALSSLPEGLEVLSHASTCLEWP